MCLKDDDRFFDKWNQVPGAEYRVVQTTFISIPRNRSSEFPVFSNVF